MHELACIAFDSGSFEWWPFASATLVAIVGGGILYFFEHRQARKDEQDDAEKKALAAALASVNTNLGNEAIERQRAIEVEAQRRIAKDADLGCDISEIREEMSHDYGQRGKSRPTFGRRARGDD